MRTLALARTWGFGALLLAADRLGQLAITGCDVSQVAHMELLTVCEACGDSAMYCPKKPSPVDPCKDRLARAIEYS
jgi:hypothetical protein